MVTNIFLSVIQVIDWLRFLPPQLYFLNYTDSKATCKSFGWNLFGDINGTLEQVRLFCEMQGPNLVWMAVSDEVIVSDILTISLSHREQDIFSSPGVNKLTHCVVDNAFVGSDQRPQSLYIVIATWSRVLMAVSYR